MFDFCIPAIHVPDSPDWLHVRLERDGDRVRLITRGGYNWTDCYPWIVEAALKNRHRQFVIRRRGRGAGRRRWSVAWAIGDCGFN
jgi:bifunctional non-homologous end joining protein LigD